MKEIRTEIEIKASPETVWKVLMDFDAYPTWNPFIRTITGKPEVGSRLSVFIQPPNGKGMTFQPRVLKADPQSEFRWLGKLGGVNGLFTGEHAFIINSAHAQAVRFIHLERFTGLVVPLFWRSLDTNTRQGFVQFNKALKNRCEQ